MSSKISSREAAKALLDQYDYFLFDCDGVIWLGDHLLPSAAETIDLLKQLNKTVIFVTNNSSKSRADYVKKFSKLGIKEIVKGEIFGSSFALAVHVEKVLQLPKNKKVWVLGEHGIEQELAELGYTTIGGTDKALTQDGVEFDPESPFLNHLDADVGCVVAGLGLTLNYLKLSVTLQYLLKDNKSIPFIATNLDLTFPMKGKLMIGAGLVIELVAYAAGRQPDAICGKPNQAMMNTIKELNPGLRESPRKGLMIGDRFNTDMKFGREGGLDTLLVLTGIETEETVLSQLADVAPTYYASKLGDLYELTK